MARPPRIERMPSIYRLSTFINDADRRLHVSEIRGPSAGIQIREI